MPQRFILSEQGDSSFTDCFAGFCPDSISIYHCQFSVNEYTDALFTEHRIVFPPTIATAVAKRRAEFLAGRYCAQKSLLALGNIETDIHIGTHRNPLWPPHIVGSISHTNTHATAVTALKSNFRGIGIDIENQIEAKTHEQIKDQILFGEEHDIIRQSQNTLPELALFTLAFSAKESFFKAAFPEVGKYFDFSSVSIQHIDQTHQTLLLQINDTLSDALGKGTFITAYYQALSAKTLATLVMLEQTKP